MVIWWYYILRRGGVVSVKVSRLASGSTVVVGKDGTVVPATGSVGSDAASIGWAGSATTAGSITGSANNGNGRSGVASMVQTYLSCSVSP
ncbi:hypothetical protein ACFX1X_028938 [Malus domestica]